MSNHTMQLTPEQVERVKELLTHAKEGTTLIEMQERIFDQGLYQLEYRYGPEATKARKEYAKRRAEEQKQAFDVLRKAQKDPELAVKLGLGKRMEL
jgi:hypothetical protein